MCGNNDCDIFTFLYSCNKNIFHLLGINSIVVIICFHCFRYFKLMLKRYKNNQYDVTSNNYTLEQLSKDINN
jgi:hypothetical protein